MVWWRRDLLSRTPIQIYAQRLLRDREAALRTRCFSRTPVKLAQHNDDGGNKRPSHMTNLEWMQLEHYERWRKRLLEDPYKTLFGASNDMLSGKGLKDWEWIHKSFPKWILQEINTNEKPMETRGDKSAQSRYPKKVEIRNDGRPELNEFRQVDGSWGSRPDPLWRKKMRDDTADNDPINLFYRPPRSGWQESESDRPALPADQFRRLDGTGGSNITDSHRKTLRDESSGMASPSDPRRPREDSYVEVVKQPSSEVPTTDPANSSQSSVQSTSFASTLAEPLADNADPAAHASESAVATWTAANASREEAAARESSFINEFLSTKTESRDSNGADNESKVWRQTVLQRRAAPGLIRKLNAQSSSLQMPEVHDAVPAPTLSTVSATELASSNQSDKPQNKNIKWLIHPKTSNKSTRTTPQSEPNPPRSASQILSQLPEDDIDFLSAADVRASMGARRSRLPTDEQRRAERQNLEKAFAAASKLPDIDSMREAKVVNDQYVRRAARQLTDSRPAPGAEATSAETSVGQAAATEVPMESGIERMKKWLETTGANFAKAFWQDPTEDADFTKSRAFFDKAAHYLKKGQAATRQITEDLEKDIPASTALLRRVKNDEQALDLAIHRLRQRSSSGVPEGLSPRKVHAMVSVKARFIKTNDELEKACKALHELDADAVANATGSFKRRLTAASKVLYKNSQLLRMLIWSLQNRLEDPSIDRKILTNYKAIADNLLALRDTQTTLMRLVDRAMLVYGVVPHTLYGDNSTAELAMQHNVNACEEPFVRARLAADAHLINEIKAHKSETSEVPDTSSLQAPTATSSKVLDELSPSAHSLFRPFGPAIEKLGTSNSAADNAVEEEKRKLRDMKLVDEVKRVYEDPHGALTVDHRQVASVPTDLVSARDEADVKKFDMLKDEPTVNFDAAGQTEALSQWESGPKSLTTETTNGTETTSTMEASSVASGENQPTNGFSSPASEGESPVATAAPESNTTASATSPINLPTQYTILVRDPYTDTLSITTSTTDPPRDNSPSLPLHRALTALDSPAKFIPYITSGLEVVSANKDILVLRDALDPSASTKGFETVTTPSSPRGSEINSDRNGTVNPIDGTTRLSPTGYVGPEESAEQLEKEFEERRRMAEMSINKGAELEERTPREGRKHEKKRGKAGVIKTVVWVAGGCYVVGVLGEVLSGS